MIHLALDSVLPHFFPCWVPAQLQESTSHFPGKAFLSFPALAYHLALTGTAADLGFSMQTGGHTCFLLAATGVSLLSGWGSSSPHSLCLGFYICTTKPTGLVRVILMLLVTQPRQGHYQVEWGHLPSQRNLGFILLRSQGTCSAGYKDTLTCYFSYSLFQKPTKKHYLWSLLACKRYFLGLIQRGLS